MSLCQRIWQNEKKSHWFSGLFQKKSSHTPLLRSTSASRDSPWPLTSSSWMFVSKRGWISTASEKQPSSRTASVRLSYCTCQREKNDLIIHMGDSGENLLGNKFTNILVHLQTNMYMYLYIITAKTLIMITCTHHAFHTVH